MVFASTKPAWTDGHDLNTSSSSAFSEDGLLSAALSAVGDEEYERNSLMGFHGLTVPGQGAAGIGINFLPCERGAQVMPTPMRNNEHVHLNREREGERARERERGKARVRMKEGVEERERQQERERESWTDWWWAVPSKSDCGGESGWNCRTSWRFEGWRYILRC